MQYSDDYWMEIALEEARKARQEDEVPVGAVLVRNNEIICQDHNRTRQYKDPTAHAEKLVLTPFLNQYVYLSSFSLYVTLEPCLMCSGMIILSRVGRVVYGTTDPKAGVCGSVYQVLLDKSFNHHPELTTGVREEECSKLLKDFFREKRGKGVATSKHK